MLKDTTQSNGCAELSRETPVRLLTSVHLHALCVGLRVHSVQHPGQHTKEEAEAPEEGRGCVARCTVTMQEALGSIPSTSPTQPHRVPEESPTTLSEQAEQAIQEHCLDGCYHNMTLHIGIRQAGTVWHFKRCSRLEQKLFLSSRPHYKLTVIPKPNPSPVYRLPKKGVF